MGTPTQGSVTWAQALAWRMQRHLLEPIGEEPVAGVVRRLGAVLATDEGLAELAVRTRRTWSQRGEVARALAEGRIIKVFAFRAPSTTSHSRTTAPTSRSGRLAVSGSCPAGSSTTSYSHRTGGASARRSGRRSRAGY